MSSIKTLHFNNNSMDYAEFGSGNKAFIILPGLSVTKVTPNAPAVENMYKNYLSEYKFYLFDRPDSVKDGYSIRDMADDTVTAAKLLGIEKATVYGVSQGGMTVLVIASLYPEFCENAIVCSTCYKSIDSLSCCILRWIESAKAEKAQELCSDFVNSVYSKNTVKMFGDALYSMAKSYTKQDFDRFIPLAYACLDFDLTDLLKNISCPLLAVSCEGDTVIGTKSTDELKEITGCKTYTYGTVFGHAVYDEAPDYVDRIFGFLSAQNNQRQNSGRNQYNAESGN